MKTSSISLTAAALIAFSATVSPAEAVKCHSLKCIIIGTITERAVDKTIQLLKRIHERQKARNRLRNCLPSHECPLSGAPCTSPPVPPPCVKADATGEHAHS